MARTLAAALAVGCLGACSDASLADVRPGLGGAGVTCQATLKFRALPKVGDVRDVRLVAHSIVLEEDQTFDWAYLTTHDQVAKIEKTWLDDQKVFVDDPSTTPESEPRAGTEMLVKLDMPSKGEVQAAGYSDVKLDLTLFWAGKQQDTASRGLFLAYQKK